MARIIIADAGPLIAFASIDALAALQKLFSEINIAESVKCECLAKAGADSQRIATAIDEGWLVTFTPGDASEPLSPSLALVQGRIRKSERHRQKKASVTSERPLKGPIWYLLLPEWAAEPGQERHPLLRGSVRKAEP